MFLEELMRFKILILLLLICILFSACKKDSEDSNSVLNDKTEIENNLEEQKTTMLYTNMTIASNSPDIKQHECTYKGELSVEKLAQALTELTGLDFIVSAIVTKDRITVDWNKDSTLIANLGDKEQKGDFQFFDADSMRWFMMDSLWFTITNNFEAKDIYYTMNNGEELHVAELYPLKVFPSDKPYAGSAFYFTNAEDLDEQMDGRGDISDISVQPFVGFWNSTNIINEETSEGYGDRYALYSDGTFIYGASELGQLREVFKTGQWSVADGILELKIEARWVIPVGDIEDLVPSDELVIFKEYGIVKVIYKEPEIEYYSIVQKEIDEETGRAKIEIDGIAFNDFNDIADFFKDFYDLPTN
jgi:hypothetical protein